MKKVVYILAAILLVALNIREYSRIYVEVRRQEARELARAIRLGEVDLDDLEEGVDILDEVPIPPEYAE